MKILTRKNLINILGKSNQDEYITLYDISGLFDKYGGEKFVVDGSWKICEEEIKIKEK